LVADLEEGPYYLRVVSDTLRRGAYTLEVLQGDHSEHYLEASMPDRVQLARAAPVRTGQALEGVLDARDPEDLPWDSATDLYLFEAQAGQSITIEVESNDIDPYVEVGSLDGDVFSKLASDDDGMGEGLNSRLQFTFERAGRYLIRISAINEVLGRYTLRVR
ncbi:MAG TPA: PPC domain-containing protein, partial [Rhodothermales bacterium]|nr:PPC domain-containing protein [Rhodothermales bacterium]